MSREGALAGKTALVTGGGTGLGLALALEMGTAGARLVLASRSEEHLAQGRARLEKAGVEVLTVPTDLRDFRLRFVERGIFTGQLSGDHQLGWLLDSKVEWLASTSRATRDEPDNREVLYEMRNGEWTFFDITQSGSRFFFDLVDDASSAKFDWTIPNESFGLNSKLKLGGKWSAKDRTFDARRFRFEQSSGISIGKMDLPLAKLEETMGRKARLPMGRLPVSGYELDDNVLILKGKEK